MTNPKRPTDREMARAEYTASNTFYNGVRKAEQAGASARKPKAQSEERMHEVLNVLEGRWMH